MSRRNGMIVKKIRNIVILLMAIIVMIGAYKNIGDSRAEDVIEIEAIAIDNYGYLENEIFKLEAIQIDDETYEIQLPESINGKEINQIVKITLEEPVPEVESEGAVQENASTENAVEGVAEENPLTEQTPTENATTSEENKEQVAETPDQQESTEQTPVEQTPTEKPTTSEENKEQTPETPVEELVGEQTPETPVEDFTGEQTPVEGEPTDQIPTEKNAIEIIDNKIRLTKEQIENKQLNIEVVYYVVILEKDEQGELVKNLLSGEGITGENSPIEITEETETLYGKILKYEDEENGKLVEVKGYLPKDAELKVEEVAQEQLVEIFGEKRIDVAYDIKIVINITKEVLVDETDPSKGTTEVLETIEINPEEFGEICQVLIKDANIQTESQVYHVKEDNTYEKVNVKENTKENITFDAQTFSIYAVTNDEDVMLTAGTEGSDQILISPEYKTSNSTINVDVTTIGWEMPDYYAWSTSTSESVASSSKVAMTGSTSADTWTVSISTPGTWYLHIWYGYEYAYSGPYLIDKSKPTCTIVDYDGSWTTANPLIVTLSGTDSGGAGISYYQWRFENASWATLQNSYNKAYHYDEQEQIVYYRCVDAAGNASEPVSVMLRMDRTAPTNLAVSNSGGGNWTNQDVTLTASATDNLSGVEKYQWSSDNSTWNDMSGSSVTFTETMNSTIYVRALDYAGNTSSTVSTEVKIDKIAPEGNITTSATLINGVYYTNQPTVTIYVNAWDTGGSDIQTLWLGAYYNPPYVNYVTNFGLTWDSTNNRFYANISLNDIVNTSTNQTNQGDGYYSIDLSILDNAGNGGWINAVHVVYDTTPPTATSAEIKNVSNTGYDVYVHGVSDNLSGVNRIQFPTWTDSGWQDDLAGNWVTNSAVSGTNLGNGTWYFRVNVSDHNYEEGWYNTHIYMYDNIENVRYISELITGDDEDDGRVFVDRTAPTLTVSPSSCDWRNSALSVTITATDPTVNGGSSGLSTSNSYQYFLSTSDSPTATGTLSNYTSGTAFDINPGTSGQYYLYVRQISDNATNTSSTSNQVTIGGVTYHRYGLYKFDYDQPIATGITLSTTYTNTGRITVTANGVEDIGGSGVEYVRWYLKDSSSWNTVFAGAESDGEWYKEIDISSQPEGWYSVAIVLGDNAGNSNDTTWEDASYIGWIDFCYDKTLPTLTVSPSSCDWRNSALSVTITATDPDPTANGEESGLSTSNSYQYFLSTSDSPTATGTLSNYTSGTPFDINPGTSGQYYLYVRQISDNATNTSSTTNQVTIGGVTYHRYGLYKFDYIAPEGNITTSATLVNGGYYTNQDTVTIYITGTDAGGSGLQNIWIATYTGGDFVEYWKDYAVNWDSTNEMWYVTIPFSEVPNTINGATNQGEGWYSFDLKMTDNAGNGGWICNVGVAYDKTPPTATLSASEYVTNEDTVTLYVSDVVENLSGINYIIVNGFYGSSWVSTHKTIIPTYDSANNRYYATFAFSEIPNTTTGDTNQGDGMYKFDAKLYDNAGNEGHIGYANVIYDTTEPTLTVSPSSCDWRNSALSVTITATDPTVNGIASELSSSNSYQYFLSTSDSPTATGTLSNYTSGIPFDINPGTSGEYYLYVRQISDNATNTSSTSNQVTIGGVTYHRYGLYKFDYIAPTATVTTSATLINGVYYTNQPTVTIYYSNISDTGGSGFSHVAMINGWHGFEYVSTYYGGTVNYDSANNRYYSTFTFSELPDTSTGATNQGDGWYTFDAHIYDNAGNCDSGTTGIRVVYDKTPPTATSTSAEIINVSNTGYDVYVHGVSDNLSGVNKVRFPSWTDRNEQDDLPGNWWENDLVTGTNLGNGTWYFRVNVSDHNYEEGWYNTHIYMYDNVGNVSNIDTTNNSKVFVDRTAPTLTVSPSSCDWRNSALSVTITATDPTVNGGSSGLSTSNSYQYFLSTSDSPTATGTLSNYTSGTAFDINPGTSGQYYLYVRQISDNATNTSSTSNQVTIGGVTYHRYGLYKFDYDQPIATGITLSTTYTNTGRITVTANGVEDIGGSGVEYVGWYIKDSSSWNRVISGAESDGEWYKEIDISSQPEGWYSVAIVLCDNAGNENDTTWEEASYIGWIDFCYDKTLPTLTVSQSSCDWRNSALSVTITATDPDPTANGEESGLSTSNSYQYFLSTSTSPTAVPTESELSGTYTSGTAFDINPGTSGEYYLYVRQISDNATNTSSTSNQVTIGGVTYHRYGLYKFDYIAPTGTLSASAYYTNQSSVTIYVTGVSDDLSGVGDVGVAGAFGDHCEINQWKQATWDSTNNRYYVTYNFSELPNCDNGTTNNGEGKYTFDAHVWDNAGNRFYMNGINVIYDLTAPTLTVSPSSCDWRNSALSVTITATDPTVNGVASELSSSNSYQYFLSTSDSPTAVPTESELTGTYTSGTAFDINPGTSGEYYLYVRQISDNATNTSSTTNQVTIGGVTYHRYGLYKFDYDLPYWQYVSKDIYYSTPNDAGNDDYANRERTVVITFKGIDVTTNVTSSLTTDPTDTKGIKVSVNGTNVAESNVTLTTTPTDASTKEVTCVLTIENITGDGTLNVVLPAGTLTDEASNTNVQKTLTTDVNITIDNTSPTLSFNVTSPTEGYYKAGQVITITATYNENIYKEITSNNLIDTTAEAPAMQLTFGGADAKGTVSCSSVSGNVITYTYTIQGPTNTEGTNGDNGTLVVSSLETVYDAAGNAILASNVTPSVNIVADTIVPTLEITANETSPTNASSITYTFTFSEGVTEFTADDVTVTNGTKGTFTETSSSVYTLVVTNSGSCTQTVSVAADKCVDRAGNGNEVAPGVSILIDRDNPTLTVNPSSADWRNSALSVTITATDPTVNGVTSELSTSNEYKYFLSTSDSPTETGTLSNYTSGTAFDINPSEGQYYLYVRQISDNATNTSSTSNQVTISGVTYHRYGLYKFDKTAPTLTVNPSSCDWRNSALSVTVTHNDTGGSGVESTSGQYFLSTSDSPTAVPTESELSGTYTSGTAFDINPSEGQYYLYVRQISDNATNTSSTSNQVTISGVTYHRYGLYKFDKTAPTLTVNPSSCDWRNSALSVTVTHNDTGGSGVESTSGQYFLSTSDSPTAVPTESELSGTYTSGTAFDINPGTSGEYYLYVRQISDNATNTSNTTNQVTIGGVTYHRYGLYKFDYDLPYWQYVSKDIYYSTPNDAGNDDYANRERTVVITFKGIDVTTNVTSSLTTNVTSSLTTDPTDMKGIKVSVNGTNVAESNVTLTTTPTDASTKEVTCVLTIENITGDGTLNVEIPAGTLTDEASNTNDQKTLTTDVDITIDNTSPTLSFNVTSPTEGYYKAGQVITITATYNENIYKEITSNNLIDTTAEAPAMQLTFGGVNAKGTVSCSSVSGNVITYTYTIQGPTNTEGTNGDNGTLVISSLETVYDAAGNAISASNVTPSVNIVADTIVPTLEITANETSPTNASSITYTFTFSEGVTEFTADDVTVTNGTKGTFTEISSSVYTLVVTNSGSCTQTVSVAADKCVDRAGNGNEVAPGVSILIDRDNPTLTVNPSSADWRNSALSVTITATDPTVNGVTSELSTSNEYKYFLSTSDSPTETGTLSNYTSGTAFDINPSEGQYYLYVRQISDNATNTSSTSNQVTISGVTYHRYGLYKFDKTAPTWTTENIKINDENNKKVIVDLVGTDNLAGYASNSLDINDITVKVDGETASSVTKELSAVTYYKEDGTVTTNESEAVKVKYTLTLSGLEQSLLQDGKIFKEWSGAVSIDVAAGSLTDKAGNTNVADSYLLGHADFIKPVIELVSANNGTTTQTIVFNVIDKYLDTTDANAAVKEDEIIVYIDGVEVSGIIKTIKSKTNLTATVNGDSNHIVGQQYTLELSNFTQDDWSGTISILVKADAVEDTTDNKNIATTLFGKHIDEVKPVIEKVSSTKDPSAKTETIVFNVLDKYLDTTDALTVGEIKVYVDNVEVTSQITKTLTKVQDFTETVNGDSTHIVGQQYQIVLSGFEKTRSIAYNQYTEYSGTVRIDVVAGAVKDIAKDSSGGNTNDLTPIEGDFVDFIKPDVNYIYATGDINRTNKYFIMQFELVDKYFASVIKKPDNELATEMTNNELATYLTTNLAEYFEIKIDGEDITTNSKVTKEIISVTDVTTTGAINKTVSGTVQSVTNAVIGKRYTLKLSNLEQNPNDGSNYSGVVSVAIKSNTVTDTSENGNLVDTTTIKTGNLPSGGLPEDGTVDVVDPVWVQAEDPVVKPSQQTATITVKATDKFYDSNSFDQTDITVLVNGAVTTSGITVQVVEDTSAGADVGKQYKVTVTGFPQTAYSLKIVINEDTITDKSGNTSKDQQFVLYTTLMDTVDETAATSLFLDNPYGIQRQYVEQIIFMETVEGTTETKWDVSALQDETIMAWYETRTVSGKTLYTVYIGSHVIMNANLNSSYLFSYIGYDSSCKVTGDPDDPTDNPLIKNLEYLRMDNVNYMGNMFAYTGYSNMKSLDLGSNFNTENVISMLNMFMNCGYTAMTSLNLGNNFDTSKVENMQGMFKNCGYIAMTSFDLGTNFNTSKVTNMNGMFMGCGYTSMTTLDLGDKFDTSKVTHMAWLFAECGREALTSLDLGDKFYVSEVTNMYAMFRNCGRTAMTSLDLGPHFTQIPTGTFVDSGVTYNVYDGFTYGTGKSGCIIYAPESIYKNMTNFKLSTDSTTTITHNSGTINPIYRPEWQKVSSTLTADGTMTIEVKGSANKEFNIGNTLTDPQKYLSDVTSSSNSLTVYVDGEVASDVTASIAMGTPTLNESTGATEITATITLKDFAKALRKTGKNFLEWTGNVSVQLARGTLEDIDGNKNLAEIGIDTSGGMDRVEIEDALTDRETSGKMFVDDIKPEFTYEYSSTSTVIDHGTETVTVVFDVTDKYFNSVDTDKFKAENIDIIVDSTQIPSSVTLGKTLTKVQDLTYTTGNGTVLTIGAKYQLVITGLDRGDGEKYSGPMTLSFPEGCITDKSGNVSDAKSITLGINEPDQSGNSIIVDVVDPIWKAENININHTNKNVTVDLVGYDKYYASNSLDIGDITVNIDGVDLTTAITDVNVKKALNTPTTQTGGVRYTLTLSNWQEAARQSGKNYLEWSGTTKITIAGGTITDQYTNTSNEQEFTLGHVDFIKPEIVEIEPTAEIQAQDAANKTETIVFTVTDKYLNTTDMVTKDEITIYVDGEDATSALKEDAQLTYVAIDGGYKYTLVIKNLEKVRNAKEYKDWSGTVSIKIAQGAAKDTNTPTANVNDETTIVGDFVDYINPNLKYTHQSTDINTGNKTYTMTFDITDKYYTSGVFSTEDITNGNIEILMQNGQKDASGNLIVYNLKDELPSESITLTATAKSASNVPVTNASTGAIETITSHQIGHTYTLTISNLEQLERKVGLTTADYSGIVTVSIPADRIVDRGPTGDGTNTNKNPATTITSGVNIPGGTGNGVAVDVVDPIWERVSSSANAINQTATIKILGTDTYFNPDDADASTLTSDEIELYINGTKNTSIIPTISAATVKTESRTQNGVTSTVQYGVEYTITVTGFAQDVNQVKIRILEDALTDKTGNGNKVTDLMLYNCLEVTTLETNSAGELTDAFKASGFLDGNNETGIARQDIEKVVFVSSIDGATASGVQKVWDVSAQNDGSIKAWTSQTSRPYTVHIGSDYEIFANQNSSALFAAIGYSDACSAVEAISGLNLLNTSSVTNMNYMFASFGYKSMTSLNLGEFDTSNVTNMPGMFRNCGVTAMTSLSLGNKFNTGNVAYMQTMFRNCGYTAMTSLDLGDEFDTSNVTNMTWMFAGTGYTAMTSLDLGDKFDTSNVINMLGMFYSCGYTAMTSLNLGANFNTSSVTNMSYMFQYCGYTAMTSLNLGTNFNTSSVTDMSYMFNECGYTAMTSLDLSSGTAVTNTTQFNTSSVTNMSGMFRSCGYTAMTSLNLGNNFDTSKVESMGNMFGDCGYTAMTSLDLKDKFDTSSVTTIGGMFMNCGYTAMTTLDLGDKFDTSKVTNMSWMFAECGREALTSLDLGDKFYVSEVTNMYAMFRNCGRTAMTSLDLGPHFTQIPTGTFVDSDVTWNVYDSFTYGTGKSGCVIYAPESIYRNKNAFKLNSTDATETPSSLTYTTGTINPIYKPEWTHSSTLDTTNKELEITLKGSAYKTNTSEGIDATTGITINYASNVTSTLDISDIQVFINGVDVTSLTNPAKALSTASYSTNATSGKTEVTHTLTLSNFEEAVRQAGVPFKEWSGNVSIKIKGRGQATGTYGAYTLYDDYHRPDGTYGNQSMMATDETGTWIDVLYKDDDRTSNESGKMFTDFIKPEITYKYANTTINHDNKTVTVVFDVVDKYYNAVDTSKFIASKMTVSVSDYTDAEVQAAISKDLHLKTIDSETTDATTGVTYKTDGSIVYNGVTIGQRYELIISELEQDPNDGFKFSGTMNVLIPADSIIDKSNNKNNAKTITIGIDEDDGNMDTNESGSTVIVDVVDPVWKVKDGTLSVTTVSGKTTATMTLVATDKYFLESTLTQDVIEVLVDGVDISDIAPDAEITLSDPTTVENGVEYTFTIANLEESDVTFLAERAKYATNTSTGRVYREFSGPTQILIPENTAKDQYGNLSEEFIVDLGTIDTLKPEVIKVSSRPLKDATNVENSKHIIVFDIVDKYFVSSAISTTDTSKIHVLLDGEEATTVTKTITNIQELRETVGTNTNQLVGYRYTLELSNFENPRTSVNFNREFTDWSGDLSIKIDANTAKDASGTWNAETILTGNENTTTPDFVDYVKPDVTYQYTDSTQAVPGDINYSDKTFTMVFDITDKHFTNSTLAIGDLEILIDGEEPDWTKVSKSLAITDRKNTVNSVADTLIGKRYTLTLSHLEQLQILSGDKYLDYSGVVTVAIPAGKATDSEGNSNDATTITSGIDIPGGVAGDSQVVDVVDPLWEKVSTSANAINQTATITVRGTDKFFNPDNTDASTLTADEIEVYVNGTEASITPTVTLKEELEEQRVVNGTTSTVQYGVEYTITITGFAKDVNQVKIKILEDAITDKSGNGNKATEIIAYNCLELTNSEDQATDGFLDGNGANLTGIARQDIEKVIFVSSIEGATASGVAKVWDVSAQNDGSIKAWTSQTSAPYTVYIGSDFEIFANQNSAYLFGFIGSGTSCTAIEMVSGLNLLNTSSVTNMSCMFYHCGTRKMTALDLGNFDTSNVKWMSSMFEECGYHSMTRLDLGDKFDTSNVEGMYAMFRKCGFEAMTTLNLGTNFNTSSVTNMACMFYHCGYTAMTSLDLGSKFDTRSVTDMSYMFRACGYTAMTTLNLGTNFNTSSVTDMEHMFRYCGYTAMTSLDLSSGTATTNTTQFNTSSVTDMENMFAYCGWKLMTSINLGTNFNTSSVTDMKYMFQECGYTAMTSLSLGDKFDTRNVTDMYGMFWAMGQLSMTSLNLGEKFDTSRVTNMRNMFAECGLKLTSLDLGDKFNTSNVTDMYRMFSNCGKWSLTTLDLGPAFTNIPKGTVSVTDSEGNTTQESAHKDMFLNCGTSSLKIYAPEAIYSDMTSFK